MATTVSELQDLKKVATFLFCKVVKNFQLPGFHLPPSTSFLGSQLRRRMTRKRARAAARLTKLGAEGSSGQLLEEAPFSSFSKKNTPNRNKKKL